MMLVGSSVSDWRIAATAALRISCVFHSPISPSNFTSISARLETNNCAAKRPSLPASAMYGLICLYSTIGERGQVYGILRDSLLQIVAHLLGNLNADRLLPLFGGGSQVRRGQQVGRREQSGVAGRLLAVNIQRGGGDMSGAQRGFHGGFVHQFAASAVHQAHAGLHLGDGIGVDHAWRSGGSAPRAV